MRACAGKPRTGQVTQYVTDSETARLEPVRMLVRRPFCMTVRYDDIKSEGCMGEWCLQRWADVDFPMQDGPELEAANHCAASVLEGCATKPLRGPSYNG